MNKEREHERDCMNPRDKNKERREEMKIERLGERARRNQWANNDCSESERKTGSRNRENTIYTQHLL